MRRALFVAVVGLGLAFGVFYALSWPATMSGPDPSGTEVGFNHVAEGEMLHAGLGPFRVGGSRNVKIITVLLNDSSPGIELVAIRVALVGSGRTMLGTARGHKPDLETLPAAAGYVLHPGDEGSINVSFRVPSPGRYSFRGITVRYQTGWITRSVVIGPTVGAET
jgi:hypothetical protein